MVCTSEVHRLPDMVSLHWGEHQFAAILWMDQKIIRSAVEVISHVVLLGNIKTSMEALKWWPPRAQQRTLICIEG